LTPAELQARGLDSKLLVTPISKSLRRAIINGVLNTSLIEERFRSLGDLEAYFSDWYEEQCEVAAGRVSVTTHRGILDIVCTGLPFHGNSHLVYAMGFATYRYRPLRQIIAP